MKVKQLEMLKDENGLPFLDIINEYESEIDEFEINSLEWIIHMVNDVFKAGLLTTEHYYVVICDSFYVTKGIYLAAIGGSSKVVPDKRAISTLLALSGAEKFLTIHNHPNKSLTPSEGDKGDAIEMNVLGNCLGVNFCGSYILTEDKWVNVENGEVHILI